MAEAAITLRYVFEYRNIFSLDFILYLLSQGMTHLALEIQQTLARLGLPFKLDNITEGDGNCFSRAVVQQCQREVVQEELKREKRYPEDYKDLKKKVVQFVKGTKIPLVLEMKREYENRQEELRRSGKESESWDKYWERMLKDKEWADAMFATATAWYLNRDIFVIPSTAVDVQPWIPFLGNWQGTQVPCPGVPLLLGYNNNLHYQSLLPTEESRSRPQAQEQRSVEEIVRAAIREAVKVTENRSKERMKPVISNQESQENNQRRESDKDAKKPRLEVISTPRTQVTKNKGDSRKRKSPEAEAVEPVPAKKEKSGECAVKFKCGEEVLTAKVGSDGRVECVFCAESFKMISQHMYKCRREKMEDEESVKCFKEELQKVRKMMQKRNQREKKSEEERMEENRKNAQAHAEARKKQSEEERKEKNRQDAQAHAEARKNWGEEKKKEEKRKNAERMERYREKLADTKRASKNRKYKQTTVDETNQETDAAVRRKKFLEAVLHGPVEVCSCCHRRLYEKGVCEVTEKVEEKIKSAKDDMYWCIEKFEVRSPDGSVKICWTCKNALTKGKMPAMAVANGLELFKDPDCPKLTELENNLIAKIINFQQVTLLHKSRWVAGKGRMISVPVRPEDVMNTAKQMPRMPSAAGLIPVRLKRKMVYRRGVRQWSGDEVEMIRPEKIFEALRFLKRNGHPEYQYFDSEDKYLQKCKEKDKKGYNLLVGEDEGEGVISNSENTKRGRGPRGGDGAKEPHSQGDLHLLLLPLHNVHHHDQLVQELRTKEKRRVWKLFQTKKTLTTKMS